MRARRRRHREGERFITILVKQKTFNSALSLKLFDFKIKASNKQYYILYLIDIQQEFDGQGPRQFHEQPHRCNAQGLTVARVTLSIKVKGE